MLRIAIVEDEESCIGQLKEYIGQYAGENGLEAEIQVFHDGLEIVEAYQPVYDIILLDIEMPRMNGMDAAESIRKRDQDVVLVFITNMAQYAIRGYAVDALDFVMKPITYYTFSMRLARAIGRVKKKESSTVLLNLPGGGVKRLDTKTIYYIESQNRMLHYHTQEGVYTVRGTMQSAEKQLRDYHFVKCNYWYLVNLMHATEMRKDKVVVGGAELEISRRNRSAFLSELTAYVGGIG